MIIQKIRKIFSKPEPQAANSNWGEHRFSTNPAFQAFRQAFSENLATCTWEPHPEYSVFTQYDQAFYLARKEAFAHKYRCFYAVSKTICPSTILELGTHAGASADAYLSAAPTAEYIGLDQFEDGVLRGIVHQVEHRPWQPREVAEALFRSRGFKNYKLIKADLRQLESLPYKSDFVVVDAAHDFENEYADLKLALTANPQYIFVDDSDDPDQAKPAIEKFLSEDIEDKLDFMLSIDYVGGGLVIKLK